MIAEYNREAIAAFDREADEIKAELEAGHIDEDTADNRILASLSAHPTKNRRDELGLEDLDSEARHLIDAKTPAPKAPAEEPIQRFRGVNRLSTFFPTPS